ncbi:hypothetical protein DV737_g3022, partial [Chaetothyriales sp. CBS 132003]
MADSIEPIAIVGMSCRFPSEAKSVPGLWEMMTKARKGHSKIPADRFNADTWYHPSHDRRGAVNVKHGFFLEDDISLFDAPFFSITAKEASGMDPMQRILLEVSYETFENAGVPMDKLVGSKTSVFCGCFTGDYDLLSNHDIFNHAPNAATGTGRAMLSNRVSWFFDLRGSSFTVDTACSSSLYALHSACQSLRLGESKQALVTGSNLALYPSMFHSLTNMHFLSPDGICHSFDDRANGYARGEAVGGLLLKPLSAALADGDTIRAVIRGSGTNQDGHTPGITMPSPESQADLIRFVYQQAGLKLSDTGFFEAHGTGTALGDPMELSAIGSTLGSAREPGQAPLYVGSIKSNIGHTEGCSGLAGVIKSVLCLEKGILVPNAGFENLNPKLRLKDWNLALPMTTMPWPSTGLRRVSVNSFGYGGSNAHVIIDDAYHYLKSHHLIGNHSTVVDNDSGSDSGISMSGSSTPPPEEEDDDIEPVPGNNRLLVFSSLDQAGLQRQASTYRSAFSKLDKNRKLSALEHLDEQTYLDDLAYTLATRRTKFDYRSFIVADGTSAFAGKLAKGLPKLKRASKENNIIMVCTGQGAQWAQMGRELLDRPVFRETTAKSQAYLEKFGATWNVFAEISKGEDSRIDSPEFSQPICTVLQISLIHLLRHWGITPKATVGHSSGEIGAAYAAGFLSHEDAIKVAYFRGVYSEDVARRLGNRQGIMMAAGVSEAEAKEYLERVTDGVAVAACINSPSSVTLSGDVSAINQLEGLLTKDGKFARKLRVKTAYHSPHMQVIADDYLQAMGDIKPKQGKADTVMYSSVYGRLAVAADFDATYWVKNMVGSVRFSEAVAALLVHSNSKSARRKTPVKWSTVVEVGPHEALKGPVNQIMASVDSKLSSNILYLAPVLRGKNAQVTALEAAGQLWSTGHSIDLAKVNGLDRQLATRKVLSDLPSYPWNHSKGFWFEPRMTTAKRFKKEPRTDLLGAPIDNQNDLEPHWRQILRISENPWMEHHEITGTILYPGAGMLIMAIEAARQLADPARSLKGIELQDVVFGRGLVIPSGDEAVETSLSLRPHKSFPDTYSWILYSLPAGGSSWVENSSGLVALKYQDQTEAVDDIETEWQFQTSTYEAIKKTATTSINMEKFYKELAAIGMGYGPTFRNLTESKAVPDTYRAHGVITIPDTKAIMPHQYEYPHLIHPATLDAIFHLLFAGFAQDEGMKESAVPVNMERMFIAADCPQGAGAKYLGYTEGTMADGRDLAGDIVLSDDQWSEPKIVISIAARKVTSADSKDGASVEETKRTAVPSWKEDFTFMESSAIESFISDNAKASFPDFEGQSAAELALWIDRTTHKDADLRVLLVADTISADVQDILSKFGPAEGQILRFRQLTIASKDEAAIEAVKEHLPANLSVKHEKLDLKAPVTDQNFGEGAFDVIIAGAAPETGAQHAALTLKPLLARNGRLVFTSTISNNVKDYATWQSVYQEAGLEKVALVLDPPSTVLAVGTAPAKEDSPIQYSTVVFLRRDTISSALETTLEKLSSQLETVGIKTEIATLSAIEDVGEKAVISFLEAETPLVINWSSGELEQFKRLALSAPYLIWITRGGQMIDSEALEFAPTTGMLRTIRTEVPQITLPHIDFAPAVDLAADFTADLILKVFNATARETPQTPELEYVATRGKVIIPRVIENTSFDREIELHSENVRPAFAPLHQAGRPLRLDNGASGSRWVEDEEATLDLATEDVEVNVSTVSLTTLDVDALSKGSGAVVGREATGVVARVGAAVKKFSVGQEVVVLKAHSYRTHLRQDQSLIQSLPAKLSAGDAAALPTTYSAAYYALVDIAHVSSSDKILIQAGSGSLGHAAVQIAKWKGAEIFLTTDSTSTEAAEEYGIPADHIFDERSDYKVQIQHAAGHLDVIFSTASGKPLRDLCALIKDFGRFVNINSEATTEQLSPTLFSRNVSFTNLDLECLFDSSLMSQLFEKVFKLLDSGSVGPIPTASHSIARLQDVVSTVKSAHGATVLTLDQDAIVSTAPPAPPALKLDPEATYILSGGLGGLGPNISTTMYEAGARHLVFLSRSGARTPDQKAVLKRLQAGGCKADAFACDVSDANDMQRVMDTAAKNGWKIKGSIQCAMVLRDSVLENMTYDKWVGATTCKIPGTWNLHSFLPDDLDFFIVLSSVVSVIGNTGQANYSAGNSYLDALAHYRHNKGLAATSFNIGLVTDATHFTEDFTAENFLQLYGHLVPVSVEDKEVNIALTAAMRGVTSDGVKVPTQVVVGIRGDLDQAAEAVESALRSSVSSSMGSSPDEVDVEKPLHTFGIDSLKAVEVRNWLFREAKADVSVFEILSPTPLNVLSIKIAAKSKFLSPELTKQAAEELLD